jgi:hypothetical protein
MPWRGPRAAWAKAPRGYRQELSFGSLLLYCKLTHDWFSEFNRRPTNICGFGWCTYIYIYIYIYISHGHWYYSLYNKTAATKRCYMTIRSQSHEGMCSRTEQSMRCRIILLVRDWIVSYWTEACWYTVLCSRVQMYELVASSMPPLY